MPRASILACAVLATACAPKAVMFAPPTPLPATAAQAYVDTVSVELDFRSTGGAGFVRLIQHPDRLEIGVIVEDAVPGQHALCVHEYGDCTDRDFLRAGLHYDPLQTDPDDDGYHIGDLGVLRVNSDGRGELSVDKYDLTLAEVLDRAVILHAESDEGHGHDMMGSGYRAACGAIEPGASSRLAEVEWELMDLRHYVQQLGSYMATKP